MFIIIFGLKFYFFRVLQNLLLGCKYTFLSDCNRILFHDIIFCLITPIIIPSLFSKIFSAEKHHFCRFQKKYFCCVGSGRVKEWLLATTRQHSPNSCSSARYYKKMFFFHLVRLGKVRWGTLLCFFGECLWKFVNKTGIR